MNIVDFAEGLNGRERGNEITPFEEQRAKELEGHNKLNELQRMIDNKDQKLTKDIELLKELEFNLRHGKVIIVERRKL